MVHPNNMKNTSSKIVIAALIFILIIVSSVLLARIQQDNASQLPYVIGSPVIPATEMPAGMVMKTFTVAPPETTPTISFTVTADTMGGWDVHVITTDFTFTPEHLGGAAVAGEGHVHLYIDNNLIIMFGPWYHIDSLTPGIHTIRVGLFNNDHSGYSVNGTHIEAEQQINVTSGSMKMAGM